MVGRRPHTEFALCANECILPAPFEGGGWRGFAASGGGCPHPLTPLIPPRKAYPPLEGRLRRRRWWGGTPPPSHPLIPNAPPRSMGARRRVSVSSPKRSPSPCPPLKGWVSRRARRDGRGVHTPPTKIAGRQNSLPAQKRTMAKNRNKRAKTRKRCQFTAFLHPCGSGNFPYWIPVIVSYSIRVISPIFPPFTV